MPEPMPTSEVPQAILDRAIKERNLAGHSVKRIDKTGSSLHILEKSEEKGIVRNAEIPADSMAVWEFLHTHAQTLFPKDVSQRLFGPWGKAQVAPILDRKGKNRVYYSGEKATAYSQMVGFDTARLMELWRISEVVSPYYFQNWLPSESRWLDCISYHLAKDILTDVPSLDPNHEVVDLLEQYWEEFTRLNQNRVNRKDLLLNKELRRQDMDRDDSYQSSLKLVESGYAISGKLVEIYRGLEQSGQNPLWKNKPAKRMLLLLTHLYQTSTQQSVIWWLGVAHSHLHLLNAVSRIPDADSPEAQISPLITSIIDFDASKVSVDKLALNDELFASIKGEDVKIKVKDQNLDPNVRLQLMFYLPLEQWDEEITQFVQQSGSRVKGELARLVSMRASKDVQTPEKYTWFTDFVYGMEKQIQDEYYLPFGLTLSMIKSRPELTQPENKDLIVTAKYYKSGELPLSDQTQLNQEQKLLLLSAIYHRHRGNNAHKSLSLSPTEMHFVVAQLKNQDITNQHAFKLLEAMVKDYYEETIPQLFKAAQDGEGDNAELAKEIITFFFSQNAENYSKRIAQTFLMNRLVKNETIDFALKLIDLEALPKDIAKLTYQDLREALDSSFELNEKPEEKAKLLANLDKRAESVFGRLYMLTQKARKMMRRER